MGLKNSVPVALVFVPPQQFNPNSCCPYNKRAVWNAEVSRNVYASNGVALVLTDAAIAQIQARYDGKPLRVTFEVVTKCQCCGGCGAGGCPCSFGDCRPVLATPIVAYDILFAREDASAMCPNIVSCTCLSCVICCSPCFEKTLKINAYDVTCPAAPTVQVMPDAQAAHGPPKH